MSTRTRRPRSTFKSARTLATTVERLPYLDPRLVGRNRSEYDRRAATLDAAATQWLRAAGKKGRTHKRNYSSADRRAIQWSPDMETPGKTLQRGGGIAATGARMHGTGKF